jgi:GH35 family endo-1,4-beta-xylanase
MKQLIVFVLAASLSASAAAQEKFEQGKPNNSDYRYLDDYQALKNYINYDKYPNFKLGIGTTVNDYLSNQTFRNLVNKNFTETVAGNAMKMQSCVDNNGNMNFETVKKYVKAATDAGLHIYGHTLAWHSQQPYVWLRNLVNGKSQQERHDTLVYVMDKWIKGMMEACDGKVKAWDLVNEALAGEGSDGEGNYPLQHSTGYKSGTWDVGGDTFYWQDHLGDLDYVRQACRLARLYGPEDIKLFINDYNLESDWDGNKKVKSLVNWIKKWEADGETHIDGIGTQMHICCFEDDNTLNSIKQHITTMFEVMAASGKLCRISEMDMGYVRGTNNRWGDKIKTAQLTEAEHQKMADFYEWIIKEYLRVIPAEQQWGICQWCPTDVPDAQYMWRRGEPVGIWDINYYRKHAYAGFVRGLGGEVYTAINGVKADKATDTSKSIYNLNGARLQAKSLDALPPGIYIVNGKKIVK